jgi:uncharacterized membrane protein
MGLENFEVLMMLYSDYIVYSINLIILNELYDLDISKCFDNISQKFIEKEIDPLLCKPGKVLIQKWIKAGIVEKGITTWPSKGVFLKVKYNFTFFM